MAAPESKSANRAFYVYGRRGTGIFPGNRCAYADATLRPRWDWQKYLYTYRVWGRFLYYSNANVDCTRRYLANEFAAGSGHVEAALANASRILPIITTAYGPSAANNNYWPELYLNQSLFDAEHFAPYSDTPAPKIFGNASPFDPQLFSRMNEFAEQLLGGRMDGKYSPLEVAQWIEDYSHEALEQLAKAESAVSNKEGPAFRRLAVDVTMQAALGKFFAGKFRAGVLYCLYEKTGDSAALDSCLKEYRKAREAWAEVISVLERCLLGRSYGGRTPSTARPLARPSTRHRPRHRRPPNQTSGNEQRAAAVH